MTERLVKYCEYCGKELLRHEISATNYAARRYCSHACRAAKHSDDMAARRATDSKVCARCGTVFPRPQNTAQKNWKRRLYCSNACRFGNYSERETRDGTPFDHDSICYCGQPATERVYFTQATALGFASDAYLDVCADCRDLFLECDPGATLTPRHSPRGARLWRNNEDTPLPYSPPHGGLAYRRTYHD